jgi:hypothetical protein
MSRRKEPLLTAFRIGSKIGEPRPSSNDDRKTSKVVKHKVMVMLATMIKMMTLIAGRHIKLNRCMLGPRAIQK